MSLTERQSEQTYSRTVESAGPSRPVLFSVDLITLDDETILMLHGELDVWTQHEFTTALDAVGDEVERLVLDLSDLTFIDAGSIGIIHQRRTLSEARGGVVELRSANPQLRKILEITGMITNDSPSLVQHRIVLPLPARAHERTSIERS